jgi:Ca2+-dependent lipid-binding protein
MDPYIKIKYEEGEIKTQVALNAGKTPTWNFKESVYIENLEQDLLIEVWEWDKNTTDDYLAAAKINL